MIFQSHINNIEGFRVKVLPARARESLFSSRRCLYTVSMGGANKKAADVLDGLRWATNEFPSCAVLLGDGLYKYTLQITDGLNPDEAERSAYEKGSELLTQLSGGQPTNHEPFRTSALMVEPDHAAALAAVDRLYAGDGGFARSIAADAANFIERQEKAHRIKIGRNAAYEACVRYLLEEVALYLMLAERGWLTDVYLGEELPTLARIIKGEIPSAPDLLKQRISVCLKARVS